jgi:hypothetical protein
MLRRNMSAERKPSDRESDGIPASGFASVHKKPL